MDKCNSKIRMATYTENKGKHINVFKKINCNMTNPFKNDQVADITLLEASRKYNLASKLLLHIQKNQQQNKKITTYWQAAECFFFFFGRAVQWPTDFSLNKKRVFTACQAAGHDLTTRARQQNGITNVWKQACPASITGLSGILDDAFQI
jgi:hypothetical protein